MVKCPYCEKENDKLGAVKIGNRYYCPECADKKNKESDDYKNLCSYIDETIGISPIIMRQIKNFKAKGFTYTGIKLTLKYFSEVQGNEMKGYGIGIVEYVYEEAKKYYLDIYNSKNKNVIQMGNFSIKEKVINKKTDISSFKKGIINMEDI